MKKEIPILATLVGLTALSGTMLSQVPKNAAAEIVDDISVTINASCTLAATGTTHSATIQPGNTVENIGNTSITVTCNDANGWSVYAVGYGGDTKGNTNLSTVISGTTYNIPTGTSGDSSYWAMKLAAVSPTPANTILSAYQSYHAVPSDYDKVASMDSISSNAPTFSTTYKAHASSSQAAGTYNGKVKYILVHPNTAIACDEGKGEDLTHTCVDLKTTTVNFTGDGVNSVTFMATNSFELQTVSATGGSVSLIPGVSYDVSVNMGAGYAEFSTTSGTISSATSKGATYTPSSSAATMTINGVLVCDASMNITNLTYMQDITPSIKTCVLKSMTTGTPYELADSRDGTTYRVAKLADGNVWMQDNLALEGGTTITSADSNITADSYTLPSSPSYWTNRYNAAYLNSGYKNTEKAASGSSPAGKVGVYYNYCAATAGTYCYAEDSAPEGVNATQDICPKGWRMPTGGSSGEYQALYTAYSKDTTSYQSALSTPQSGYLYSTGGATYIGPDGNFWSSTWRDGRTMHKLNVRSSSVYPTTSSTRDIGNSVRCVVSSE